MIRAVLAPLARGTTYRRGMYLLLGGVLALPYGLLGGSFARLLVAGGPQRLIGLVLLAVAAAIAVVPAFLSGTRAVEIAAVRWLLRVDLPDPPAGTEPTRVARETRLRTALWFATHLVVGGAVGLLLLAALPMALLFLVHWIAAGDDVFTGTPFDRFGPDNVGWLSLLGALMLVAVGYAVAGLGALAATMAPVLLGPSPTERIAALEAHATRLAERNRLARELHDSVGHALTVTTLQAAAARELLDRDPEFARRALAAIEQAGRTAMEDLDHVLGVLRDGEPAGRAPGRTLDDLDRLVADADATGVAVRLLVSGPVADVPAAVSREGYRIIQESLTNVRRHAGPVPVDLRVDVDRGALTIALDNPARPGGDPARGGRGLTGMRERVTLLGGEMTAGPDAGRWRVAVRLPVGGPA